MPQTGATRYQKFLKSEKSKTKLKNKQAKKKDLPRGTNVTKTNFKVKQIVIKEQLKQHGDNEALSARKLNAKELLSRLNHFNTQSCKDALEGIKELISGHVNVLEDNLGQLINGVAPLVLNIETVVRREALKVLHLILSNVTVEKTEPFFDILSTYLRSAMTHIDNRIQEDSLLFLDILLICCSENVAKDFHRIIPNFLDMISKLRVDSKPGRTLTVNLNSQITSVKWRVKVLHRLQEFLRKYVEHNKINVVNKELTANTKFFDSSKMNHYPLYNHSYTAVCHVSSFSAKNTQDASIDEAEKFIKYIEMLMPLLFEAWVEVCASANPGKNIETLVSEDSAGLLKRILEVVTLLWDLVQYLNKKNPHSNIENLFRQNYRKPFSQHFVQPFPFATNIRSRQQRGNQPNSHYEDFITDPKLIIENLLICQMFIALNPNVHIKNQSKEISSVLNYMEKIFNENVEEAVSDLLIKILDIVFSNDVNNWTRTLSVMDALLRKVIWAYFNKNLPSQFRQKIFSLLCKIALSDKLAHFHASDAYDMWLKNLPDILLEDSVTVQVVDILNMFAVANNTIFNSVVKPKLLKIIENLPNISVSDSVNPTSYYKIFSLLYWIKCWDDTSLNLLENQLINNAYDLDHGKYIFDTLRHRSASNV